MVSIRLPEWCNWLLLLVIDKWPLLHVLAQQKKLFFTIGWACGIFWFIEVQFEVYSCNFQCWDWWEVSTVSFRVASIRYNHTGCIHLILMMIILTSSATYPSNSTFLNGFFWWADPMKTLCLAPELPIPLFVHTSWRSMFHDPLVHTTSPIILALGPSRHYKSTHCRIILDITIVLSNNTPHRA